MARDEFIALTAILQTQGNMDESQAVSYIKKLQSDNCFLQDLWSWEYLIIIHIKYITNILLLNNSMFIVVCYTRYVDCM